LVNKISQLSLFSSKLDLIICIFFLTSSALSLEECPSSSFKENKIFNKRFKFEIISILDCAENDIMYCTVFGLEKFMREFKFFDSSVKLITLSRLKDNNYLCTLGKVSQCKKHSYVTDHFQFN